MSLETLACSNPRLYSLSVFSKGLFKHALGCRVHIPNFFEVFSVSFMFFIHNLPMKAVKIKYYRKTVKGLSAIILPNGFVILLRLRLIIKQMTFKLSNPYDSLG